MHTSSEDCYDYHGRWQPVACSSRAVRLRKRFWGQISARQGWGSWRRVWGVWLNSWGRDRLAGVGWMSSVAAGVHSLSTLYCWQVSLWKHSFRHKQLHFTITIILIIIISTVYASDFQQNDLLKQQNPPQNGPLRVNTSVPVITDHAGHRQSLPITDKAYLSQTKPTYHRQSLPITKPTYHRQSLPITDKAYLSQTKPTYPDEAYHRRSLPIQTKPTYHWQSQPVKAYLPQTKPTYYKAYLS